ncbi:hypothetical protein V1277_003566 [Bradyrhizobium sp. AZCC 1588]|uniref:hypothetical protein n=1 Tax=unclassified Bradyrhizobium TaxID=2631580 RepID=UPI002FF4145D
MLIDWNELELAVEFVSSGPMGIHEAVLCRKTGKFLWHTELFDDADDWPEDADDEEKYLSIPHKKELDLGKALVFEFARQFLPEQYDEIRRMFSKRGAYERFKGLLQRRKALDRWFEFENRATETALREWCDANGLTIRKRAPPAQEPEQR